MEPNLNWDMEFLNNKKPFWLLDTLKSHSYLLKSHSESIQKKRQYWESKMVEADIIKQDNQIQMVVVIWWRCDCLHDYHNNYIYHDKDNKIFFC